MEQLNLNEGLVTDMKITVYSITWFQATISDLSPYCHSKDEQAIQLEMYLHRQLLTYIDTYCRTVLTLSAVCANFIPMLIFLFLDSCNWNVICTVSAKCGSDLSPNWFVHKAS